MLRRTGQQQETSPRNTQTAKQSPRVSPRAPAPVLSFTLTVGPLSECQINVSGSLKLISLPPYDRVMNSWHQPVSLPAGRLSTAICRLCHGKFSPRSLRHAFTWPQDSIGIAAEDSDGVSRSPLFFHTDFQQLVGVPLDRDPRLSEFICKKCHAKFYKCHSILIRFLQRVNLPPVGEETLKHRQVQADGAKCSYSSHFNITFSVIFRKNAKCPESSVNHGPKSK